MLRKILIGSAAALVVLLIVIATRPSTFHVERSIAINAPPERPFAQVNDFHRWSTWSPYEKLDPELARTFEGPTSGVGAAYGWTGDKAGQGTMTIEKSEPSSQIAIKLVFIKPMATTNTATFTFAPAAGGTRVTWAMDGQVNFIGKAFSLVMDMDKLVGGDFERGLANLKTFSEGPATAEATAK